MKNFNPHKMVLAVCSLGLALMGVAVQSAFAQIVTNGDFEANGTSGYYNAAPPDGWNWGGGSGTAPFIVGGGSSSPFTNVYPLGDKAVLIGNDYQTLSQGFTLTTASQVRFNFDVLWSSAGTTPTYISFYSGQGQSALFQIGASLTVSGGVNDTPVLTPTVGLWYNVRGTFNYAAGTFNGGVYTIAGGTTPVATFSDTLRSGAATGVDSILIGDYFTEGSNPGFYIDNFSITEVTATNVAMSTVAEGVAIRWFATNNVTYNVLGNTNLANNVWTNASGPITGNGTTNTFFAPYNGIAQRFYKVISIQ